MIFAIAQAANTASQEPHAVLVVDAVGRRIKVDLRA